MASWWDENLPPNQTLTKGGDDTTTPPPPDQLPPPQNPNQPPTQPPTTPNQNDPAIKDKIMAILAKYGNSVTRDALSKAKAELNALGVHIQNEERGDLRPRLLLPNKTTVDLGDFDGPYQWVDRGDMGDWNSPNQQGGPGGGGFKAGSPSPGDSLRNTPGYQFDFDEGVKAVQRSAAAKGTLLTGGTLKALTQYGQGLADRTYNDAFNRWMQMAKLGATPPPGS